MSEQRNARDQAVDLLHEAFRGATFHVRRVPWGDDYWSHGLDANSVHKAARLALDALLTARDRTQCPTCGLTTVPGFVPVVGGGTHRHPDHPGVEFARCPERCTDGTIDSGSLLLAVLSEAGMLEQVGWAWDDGNTASGKMFTWNTVALREKPEWESVDEFVPVYRVSPYE